MERNRILQATSNITQMRQAVITTLQSIQKGGGWGKKNLHILQERSEVKATINGGTIT